MRDSTTEQRPSHMARMKLPKAASHISAANAPRLDHAAGEVEIAVDPLVQSHCCWTPRPFAASVGILAILWEVQLRLRRAPVMGTTAATPEPSRLHMWSRSDS